MGVAAAGFAVRLGGRPVRVKQVEVVDAQGKTVRPVKFEQVIGGLTLKIPKTDFGWRVTVE